MAFQVVDPTNPDPADNAFASIAEGVDYLTDRNRVEGTPWADTTANLAVLQAALIAATDFIEKRFSALWIGAFPSGSDQGLSWPRTGDNGAPTFPDNRGRSIASNSIPVVLKHATIEYAARAVSQTLIPDPSGPSSAPSGLVIETRKKVEGMETQTKYAAPTQVSAVTKIPEYPEADLILDPLLKVTDGQLMTGFIQRV